jgi:alkylated DNA repair protein (DNA oxidative demethylase)
LTFTRDLFEECAVDPRGRPGLTHLPGFALPFEPALLAAIAEVAAAAPFRHMLTPGGQRMSVAMTNCGEAGWVSDRKGYRYDPLDPETGRPWPALPECLAQLAGRAAAQAGFAAFRPDVCLINRYQPGARMSLHQDRDERDFSSPIVSVSLGLDATFLFGGLQRSQRPHRLPLAHGDVVVWGAATRLAFHGVAPLADGCHPTVGRMRLNLTLRHAL